MKTRITGGAGFIGSHLADELLRYGHDVRVLDALAPQVHGPDRSRPAYPDPSVELIVGDVSDRRAVARALRGVDVVFHFAAAVGVDQSMYEIAHYTNVNNMGTAVLLEALSQYPVERLVVASSMSIYGEGACRRADGAVANPPVRTLQQLRQGQWELIEDDGSQLEPGEEVLVARDGRQVAEALGGLTPARAKQVGAAARRRVLAEHTYDHRAAQLEEVLDRQTILSQSPLVSAAVTAGGAQ